MLTQEEKTPPPTGSTIVISSSPNQDSALITTYGSLKGKIGKEYARLVECGACEVIARWAGMIFLRKEARGKGEIFEAVLNKLGGIMTQIDGDLERNICLHPKDIVKMTLAFNEFSELVQKHLTKEQPIIRELSYFDDLLKKLMENSIIAESLGHNEESKKRKHNDEDGVDQREPTHKIRRRSPEGQLH
ncbi:hypothetical protein BS50DRAFT_652743 [Corynespora cassiicola Philippines]|uniref:Uncharacterized protein n=1 Tax=Corynespora cassiicola Philippines TaxID=1448308 RepID=A0A2T2N6P0_CORCC|nr:hypothetical protein BS50DRAFT_652743 [Corynespora cassiicola Philippines]